MYLDDFRNRFEELRVGHNPYWVLFCMREGIDCETRLVSYHEFICWISVMHREFEPDRDNRIGDGYTERFTEWLIVRVHSELSGR